MRVFFYILIIGCFAGHKAFAQVPVMLGISGPSAVCSVPSTAPNLFNASATNSPTNYVWSIQPAVVNMTGAGPLRSVVFPNTNLTYTIFCYATNASGASNTSSFVITVFETPTVTFSGNNLFVCQGSSTNLSASSTIIHSASSSLSYTWSPSVSLNITSGYSVVASPTVTTNYVVLVALGTCTNGYQVTVFVQPPASVSVNSSASSICEGETAVLTITGNGTSYYLDFVPCPLSVIVSPSVSTTYTVRTLKDNCEAYATITQSVDACLGINSLNSNSFNETLIYPNPSNGTFIVKSPGTENIYITNELGQVIRQVELRSNEETEIRELPQGIYFFVSRNSKNKIVVTR